MKKITEDKKILIIIEVLASIKTLDQDKFSNCFLIVKIFQQIILEYRKN